MNHKTDIQPLPLPRALGLALYITLIIIIMIYNHDTLKFIIKGIHDVRRELERSSCTTPAVTCTHVHNRGHVNN